MTTLFHIDIVSSLAPLNVLSNSELLFLLSSTTFNSRPSSSLDLPQEPPAVIESNRVPAYWPSSSNNDALIRVENLEVKYASDLPAVLHDVSFTLKAGESVGLLGRTGSFCFIFLPT